MKTIQSIALALAISFSLASCAVYPISPTQTEMGAVMGAGMGALIGQAIGGDTKSTIAGLAAGTILGALVGNAADQAQAAEAVRYSAAYGKPTIYYDEAGRAVEAIPEPSDDPNCYNVRKRIWDRGTLVEETVEKICGAPLPQAGVVYPPPTVVYPPPVYGPYPPPAWYRPPYPPPAWRRPYGPPVYWWPPYWGFRHHRSGDR